MITHFANGYVLSRDFDDRLARIRATEIGRRFGPDITDGTFALMAVATCERFGDTSQPIVVSPTGPSGYEAGVWITESQAYAVIKTPRVGVADILLRQVIRAFVDLRGGRLTSVLGEPVTPAFNPKESGGGYYLSEFDSLYICLASEAELPPGKRLSAAIADTVAIFDGHRRRGSGPPRRTGRAPLHLV